MPEKREVLTTEGGLNVIENKIELEENISCLREVGIRVSLFIDPDQEQIEAACEVIEKINMPVLVGLHLKKNAKLASGENITEIVKNYRTNNWLGLIGACVSLEIIKDSCNEMSN